MYYHDLDAINFRRKENMQGVQRQAPRKSSCLALAPKPYDTAQLFPTIKYPGEIHTIQLHIYGYTAGCEASAQCLTSCQPCMQKASAYKKRVVR